jgi:polyhydroxyalkanoate synthesis regulator phasin
MDIITIEAAEVAADMNETEARQVVDDIKRGINTVRARIYELDRRKGWKALGYRSFAACCMAEFPELHARTIQKQLAAAQVEASLKDLRPAGRNFAIGSTPETHLRPLVSVKNDEETLVAAYEKAQEIADEENKGKLTEAIVTRAVEEVRPEYEWSQSELERKAYAEAGGTVVANMHQDSDRALLHWAKITGRFARIDRNSDWGNPFEMPADGDRDTVCDSYEIFFRRKFSLHDPLEQLNGKVLGCWCYPKRCHGDYLIKILAGSDLWGN